MVSFECKVLSVHPASSYKGDRLVCVEFGIEDPLITGQPASQEFHNHNHSHPMQQRVPLSNRIVLFLTLKEWHGLKQKYSVEEKFACEIDEKGGIKLLKE